MPRFREVQTVTAISHLRANASWDGFTAGEDAQVAVYNPPPGWVVLETQVTVHSSNNGSRSVSTLAGGLNLVTESIIESVYKDAIEAAGKYKDKSIEGKLKSERDERKKEVRSFSTNKNSIVARAQAKAHGSFIDKKRGWEEISVAAKLFYIGEPSSASIAQEIERAYKISIQRIEKKALLDLANASKFLENSLELEKWSADEVTLEVEINAQYS